MERCRTCAGFSCLNDAMQVGGKRKKEIKIKRLELLFCHSLMFLSVTVLTDWLDLPTEVGRVDASVEMRVMVTPQFLAGVSM